MRLIWPSAGKREVLSRPTQATHGGCPLHIPIQIMCDLIITPLIWEHSLDNILRKCCKPFLLANQT